MLPMTIREIAAAVEGTWLNPRENTPPVTEVCTDSRKISEGFNKKQYCLKMISMSVFNNIAVGNNRQLFLLL